MKKKFSLKFILSLWDGIWSVPISFLVFVFFGVIIQKLMGSPDEGGPGFYSAEFWQAALLSIGELVLFNTAIWLGFYFTFRSIFKYYQGEKKQDGSVENLSKIDFKNIKAWQRLLILLYLYCFWLLILVMLYRSHV